MDLSVLVVNYNAEPFLARCLRSLNQHLAGLASEICVVDNASTDGSVAIVREQFPQVRLLENSRNLGFAVALNLGLRQTTGRYVLWLNPDAELLDDGLRAVIQHLETHPRVGIVGPQLVDPDGRRQLSARSFPSYRTAFVHRYALLTRWAPGNRWSRHYLHADWEGADVREVDWVSGACLLHRREVAEQLGGLDERFFMYCEDVDFCLRASQRGWRVEYHPGARVLHQIGGSSRPVARRMVVERHRSIWRYYRKHFRPNPLKDLVVGAALGVRCGYLMVRGGD